MKNKNSMRMTKITWRTWLVTIWAIVTLAGCEGLETYSIDAPMDLQSRIDAIAAEKAKISTGDTVYIDIVSAIIGAEDNSSGWWGAFSDYFVIPANKLLVLEFVNHSSGVNNWNNWNLVVTNEVADRDDTDYKEYFVLRSDAYGWGGGMVNQGYPYDAALIAHNYPDLNGDGDIWDDFKTTMQGARVTLKVDHSATGNVFVTATAIGTNGVELILTYQQPVSATANIVAFLVTDASYFEMKKAYLIPSKVTVVEDVEPVSIVVEGAPEFVEFGNEDFWGDATATVTYADGSSETVGFDELSFTVIPDMSTLGKKTVIVAYGKSKQGAYGPPVSTFYTLEVTNPVVSLEVTTLPNITEYYFFSGDSIIFNTRGLVVTGTYSDGTTGVVPNATLQFSKIPALEGVQSAKISYVGSTSTVSVTCPVTLVKGSAQVGKNDFSTGWWSEFSDEYAVATGTSQTLTMYCYSNNLNNYHSPCVILRKADLTEYAVVRMDNFGWGTGYSTATLSSDWNFDTFASNINGSKVVITVTNHGNDTADVVYTVTHVNGETHFQKYEGITVDSDDLNFALVIEGAYVVII
jgi:hypothetical protein